MGWWRDFFDEDYPLLYSAALTPERTEREVAAVVALLQLQPGARVLDLCCADGRHSVALQRRGFQVVGVDASLRLLQRARARAERVLSPSNPEEADDELPPHPRFACADVRALPLLARFEAALLLFSSIGYGSDDDTLAMLRAARGALVPGGQLLVECAHRDLHVQRIGPTLHARDQAELDGVRVFTERRLDPVAGVEHATFRFQRPGRPEVEKQFRQRLYAPTELSALLERAGCAELRAFGDYDGSAFTPQSPFLLLHARAA